jgi:hypothetical protein
VICISYALKFVPEVIYKSCEYNIITLQKRKVTELFCQK